MAIKVVRSDLLQALKTFLRLSSFTLRGRIMAVRKDMLLSVREERPRRREG